MTFYYKGDILLQQNMYLTNNLKYDKENLDKVSKLILDNLKPDLVAVKFRARNAVQPLFGYCYPASACLQKIFGSKNIKLYHAKDDEDIWHWWTVDKDKEIIDLTADQYYSTGRTPPYDKGKKAGQLGWGYRKKVQKLLTKVLDKL